MDTLDKRLHVAATSEDTVRHNKPRDGDKMNGVAGQGQIPVGRDGIATAALVAAGVSVVILAGLYLYRLYRRKPMTRLQQLKVQLGLTEADFRDLKANLGKSDTGRLRELKKPAW